MTEQVEFERIDLEKFRVTVLHEMTMALFDDFAMRPVVDLSLHARWSADTIAFRVKQAVYGETLDTLEIDRPATWFQMLKEQHAPYWFKRRWPVRYTTETYDARALYPKLAMPDEANNRVWVASYGHAHTEPERSGER